MVCVLKVSPERRLEAAALRQTPLLPRERSVPIPSILNIEETFKIHTPEQCDKKAELRFGHFKTTTVME